MNRKFGNCSVLTFLLFSSSCFAKDAPATKSSRAELSISVHDYADVPPELLAAAEDEAYKIFHRAGLETIWLNCSPKLEKTEPSGCYITDSSHLVLRVQAHGISAQVRDRMDVLGIATLDEHRVGFYGYIFYDRVQKLAAERKLGFRLLGDVLAHEIGHLLLGSTSHSVSGIMSGRWDGAELRRISEGAMFFTSVESKMIRNRLESDRSGHAYSASTVNQHEISPAGF